MLQTIWYEHHFRFKKEKCLKVLKNLYIKLVIFTLQCFYKIIVTLSFSKYLIYL